MVFTRDIWITPFQLNRKLHIYMPENIQENERFPVLYMFDGHNLFYDNVATYGKSWGIKEYLDNNNGRVIVVGLECNHNGNERLNEFTPYDFYEEEWGYIEQRGQILIDWMVNELKPFIDSQYPTKPERDYTYIGGSSMGGTMSLYMAMHNSKTFSKAICVSPHIYPMYKKFREEFDCHIEPNTQIYISWGGNEYPTHQLFATVTDQNLQIIRALLKKTGVDVIPHVFKNDAHCEQSWQKELPIWMKECNIA
ncbi:alpha/beta hydrolase [Floccifex sp.]|uniref:alpha/beta hydrolase n=1 Tax=Floccifex sp. TaxID=2815810 RepID=UPI002A76184C|nr:alpha/beta hydrolase-fold protein [Floccifex sp.]MDY2957537.1 alpha/beta hydrolase-fold protein [Floccifex sp.]